MFDSRDSRTSGKDESGLVGIGVLVVFASIVIVSAVAAGVLINTSFSLQQQARATTKDTVSQVSSGVNILDAKGRTSTNAKEIENIELVVRPYPGTEAINLERTIIQYKSEKTVGYLNYDDTGEILDNEFDVIGVQDQSETGPTSLQEMGDIARIQISLSEENRLDEGSSASITIVPSSGFKTYYQLIVPATLGENKWYIL